MERSLKLFAVFTAVLMFILMIAGALVTNTGSAQGCGNDWPLCNGKFIPTYTLETLIEYTHRLITGAAGIIVFIFAIWTWRRYRGNSEVRSLAIISILFIIVESLLGASAVIWPQSPPALALHFGFSLLAFTGVFLLSIFVLQRDKSAAMIGQSVSRGFRFFAWITVIYTYMVIYLGAYVRHSGASLAYPAWPLLGNGTWFPELPALAAIQLAHRFAAFLLFFMIVGMAVYSFRHYRRRRRDLYGASMIALLLVIAQIFSGIYVIVAKLSVYGTLLHSAIITGLFGILCYLCLQTLKPFKNSGKQV
ncbi:COX15/CtaA family protein [Aneurinibacillus tyrosinisolvens]|uniref:COX15/CtaA family protein n=1 Tax=Aneurinibacillus tyrosinisolvens TaxID=1443435 RepID=UPI00063FCDD7|nr:heme A synthase [Aneurinibacillus tyrosinisolvens]